MQLCHTVKIFITFSWKEVIPTFLEKLEDERSIKHGGSDVTGVQKKKTLTID